MHWNLGSTHLENNLEEIENILINYKPATYNRYIGGKSKIRNEWSQSTGDKTLDSFLPKPKGTTTLLSFLRENKPSQFTAADKPISELTQQYVKDLIGATLAKATEAAMTNHYYEVGGNLYKQTDGGSMGVDLAG